MRRVAGNAHGLGVSTGAYVKVPLAALELLIADLDHEVRRVDKLMSHSAGIALVGVLAFFGAFFVHVLAK